MKRKFVICMCAVGVIAGFSNAGVLFSDNFENGLTEWTIGGRRQAGENVANTVLRHGSMMGHLYKTSFTEVLFERTFEYKPLLRLDFDMEVTASSQTPPASNYYGRASATIAFLDSEDNVLGGVSYATATTSYIFDIAANSPTSSRNQVTAGILDHYSLTMDELLSQITIDENAISNITMEFSCYSSTHPYPSVSAELWVDDFSASVVPEPCSLVLLGLGGLISRRRKV